MKKISIGFTTFNGEAFLDKSINSLLNQTYGNFEFIISDDASRDRTEEICKSFALKDNRIRYYRQTKNVGLVDNFAFVLEKATGDYFMWAAHDDWWEETFLEKMVKALDENSDYVVAMSHFKTIYSDGRVFETSLGHHDFTPYSNYQLFKILLRARDNPIFEYGLWRTIFLKKLFARKKPHCIEDTVILMSEAGLSGKFYSVKEMLHMKYRDPRSGKERHYYGKYYEKKFPFLRYLLTMICWMLSSRVIPLKRKPLIIYPWLGRVWRYKRKLVKEILNLG